MKKFITLSIIIFSVFTLANITSASEADMLQPATTITYNEDLVVNGTGRFNSAYIGATTGEGGVTFFNGTMINASEGDVPLTMGDDLRIDGMIWRGETKGTADNMPLKIADTLMPALDNINDIGTEDMRWRNIYFSDTLSGVSASFTGVTSDTGAFSDELTVADYIAVGGGYGSTGSTLDSSGNGQFDGDLTVDGTITSDTISTGNITTTGDIIQDLDQGGAVKAMALVDGSATGCNITRQFSSQGTTITCTRSDTGRYLVDFGFQVNERFYQATPHQDANPATIQGTFVSTTNNNQVRTTYRDSITGGFRDGDFMISIY